jgi:hypothetical protein
VEDKKRIRGVLPLYFVDTLFGKRLVSVPLRDRGAPLYDDQKALTMLLDKAKQLSFELRCNYVELRTMSGLTNSNEQPMNQGFIEHTKIVNVVVPLSTEPNDVWKKLHKNSVVWAINRAKAKGVKCFFGENQSDLEAFYGLFLRTRRKLGVPPHHLDFFKHMWDLLGNNGLMKLLLAKSQNRIIGGLVLFYFKDRVICAYAASDERFLHKSPNNLLHWEAICDACRGGYKFYDFGGTPPHNKNLLDFKRRWGSVESPMSSYYYLNNSKKIPVLKHKNFK